jgi:O-methyltransferase
MTDARDLYIQLLKSAVAFSLWDEPGVPLDRVYMHSRRHRRLLVKAVARVATTLGLRTYGEPQHSVEDRQQGRIWPSSALTMIGRPRLDNLHRCTETVLREGLAGDFIETGVWRGGAVILLRGILKAHGADDRRVFVADSFRGLPRPEPTKFPADRGDRHHTFDLLAVTADQVRENFRRFGLLDEQVVFLEGWFKDTLPSAPIETLALMRLDGDMYQSTIEALESLYPKLSSGGFCIVDDYALSGCRQAVDDYRTARHIEAPMQTIDWTGVYWRKA